MGTAVRTTGNQLGRRRWQTVVAMAVLGGAVAGIVGLSAPSAAANPILTNPVRLDECGLKIQKSSPRSIRGGDYWDCSFVDNFSTPTLDSTKWMPQKTATSNYTLGDECQVDTPNNIGFVDDPSTTWTTTDHLRLTARKEAAPFTCTAATPSKTFTTQYTGATVMTYTKFSQTYGRFEVRAKLPQVNVPGAMFSFWLYRTDLQAAGEIDPMEWYSKYSDRGIPALHGATAPWTNTACIFDTTKGPWHTYTLEWTPQSIKVLYDGVTCLENKNWGTAMPAPFNTPMMVALTIGKDPVHLDTTGSLPPSWSVDVDYVKAWT